MGFHALAQQRLVVVHRLHKALFGSAHIAFALRLVGTALGPTLNTHDHSSGTAVQHKHAKAAHQIIVSILEGLCLFQLYRLHAGTHQLAKLLAGGAGLHLCSQHRSHNHLPQLQRIHQSVHHGKKALATAGFRLLEQKIRAVRKVRLKFLYIIVILAPKVFQFLSPVLILA